MPKGPLYIFIIIAIFSLTACGLVRSNEISNMDSTQIVDVSDKSLCNPLVAETQVVIAEKAKRNLGDCTPDHRQCLQMGFPIGTEQYLQCRSMLLQAEAQQQATDAQIYNATLQKQQFMTPRASTTTTTCTGMGNTVNCTGVTR